MMETGKVGLKKVSVCRFGQMELNIKECGSKEKPLAKANLLMSMEILIKGNGNKIKPTVTVYIII